MATYKVLQDIEAEDKLFGPFTLKQFIFGAVAIILGFIEFRLFTMGIPVFLKAPLILMFFLPMVVFGFLAAPIGRDQPNDVWLLARLRFLFKPRVRIWNQDGMSDLVTITAPKQDTRIYVNPITQGEVKSRLQALANTVDTRGWAVKNVNANLFNQPGYLSDDSGSDRLVSMAELPQDVPTADVTAADDIMDPLNNSTAQNLDAMMQQATSLQHQQAAQLVSQASAPLSAPVAQDYWFMDQPDPGQTPAALPADYSTFGGQQTVTPGSSDAVPAAEATAEEEAFAKKLAEEQKQAAGHSSDHMKVLQPLHDSEGNLLPQAGREQQAEQQNEAPTPQNPPMINPAVQVLAQNNDLNVATLARQAKQLDAKQDDGEVTISLR